MGRQGVSAQCLAPPAFRLLGAAPGGGSTILGIQTEWLQGDHSRDAGIDVHMHPLTLRFAENDLEAEFEEAYFSRTLSSIRMALIGPEQAIRRIASLV